MVLLFFSWASRERFSLFEGNFVRGHRVRRRGFLERVRQSPVLEGQVRPASRRGGEGEGEAEEEAGLLGPGPGREGEAICGAEVCICLQNVSFTTCISHLSQPRIYILWMHRRRLIISLQRQVRGLAFRQGSGDWRGQEPGPAPPGPAESRPCSLCPIQGPEGCGGRGLGIAAQCPLVSGKCHWKRLLYVCRLVGRCTSFFWQWSKIQKIIQLVAFLPACLLGTKNKNPKKWFAKLKGLSKGHFAPRDLRRNFCKIFARLQRGRQFFLKLEKVRIRVDWREVLVAKFGKGVCSVHTSSPTLTLVSAHTDLILPQCLKNCNEIIAGQISESLIFLTASIPLLLFPQFYWQLVKGSQLLNHSFLRVLCFEVLWPSLLISAWPFKKMEIRASGTN